MSNKFVNLNKENFWDELAVQYPDQMQEFSDWIDKYKFEVGWNKLFAANEDTMQAHSSKWKFHEIPIEMQMGIIGKFIDEIRQVPKDRGHKRAREFVKMQLVDCFAKMKSDE